ncbi:MAG: hypothetical protein WA426_18795, partial [Silvibacterium sp.]
SNPAHRQRRCSEKIDAENSRQGDRVGVANRVPVALEFALNPNLASSSSMRRAFGVRNISPQREHRVPRSYGC